MNKSIKSKKSIFCIKYLVLLIFAVIAFATFFNTIDSSFHFDDALNITRNSDVAVKDLSLNTLKRAALTSTSGLRPFSYLTFALNYYISGMDTTSYHVINIIIHIINAFLIYLIILTLFDYGAADDGKKESLAVSAFFTTLFWLVIPSNSQAVILIVQRMTLLMSLFFLLAFFTYLLGRKKKRAVYFVLTGIFFVLSLLSKQNAVTFPLVIILYELVFVKKGDIKSVTKKETVFFAACFLVIFATLFLYKGSIIDNIVKGYAGRDFSMYERVLTQPRVLLFYLSLLILPLPGRLSITYDIVKSTSLFSPITTLLSIILIIAIFVMSIVRVKKSPYLSFAILWFFITISVESSILPQEMVYEHRMYLPCIFLIGAFIDFVTGRFYERDKAKVAAVFCGVVIIFGIMTGVRGRAWENEFTLWNDTVSKFPNDERALYNLGNEYRKMDDFDKAEKYYLLSIESDPDYAMAYNNLGGLYKLRKEYAKAIKYLKKANELDPDNKESYYNIGVYYLKFGDIDQGIKYLEGAISVDPEYYMAYFPLARSYSDKKKHKKALELLQKALNSSQNEKDKKMAREEIKLITKRMNSQLPK
jgi:Tfp pilus assembly protein PilF